MEGPLTVHSLLGKIAETDDWDDLRMRRGRTGQWFTAAELEGRLSGAHGRRRLFSVALLALAVAAGVALGAGGSHALRAWWTGMADPASRQRSVLAGKLMQAGEGLPKKIDGDTIRTGVSYDDPTLSFSNVILLQPANVPDAARADISRAVTSNTCAFAEARKFLAAGGTIAFSYADIEARPLMTVSVKEAGCF